MPLWSEILDELAATSRADGPPNFDGIRRKYLDLLNWHINLKAESNRDTILYASAWVQ